MRSPSPKKTHSSRLFPSPSRHRSPLLARPRFPSSPRNLFADPSHPPLLPSVSCLLPSSFLPLPHSPSPPSSSPKRPQHGPLGLHRRPNWSCCPELACPGGRGRDSTQVAGHHIVKSAAAVPCRPVFLQCLFSASLGRERTHGHRLIKRAGYAVHNTPANGRQQNASFLVKQGTHASRPWLRKASPRATGTGESTFLSSVLASPTTAPFQTAGASASTEGLDAGCLNGGMCGERKKKKRGAQATGTIHAHSFCAWEQW